MPFALLIIGIVLLVSGVRGTQDNLFSLVKGDFTGEKNFIGWVVSILIIGALGYITPIKNISRAFLILLIVVLFVKNGGVFDKFNKQIFVNSSSLGNPAGTTEGIQGGGGIGS